MSLRFRVHRRLFAAILAATAALAAGIVVAVAAPGAPTIDPFEPLTRNPTPTFSWSPAGEPGGTYYWVLRPGNSSSGRVVAESPSGFTATSATMPALADGSYNLRVQQTLGGETGPFSSPASFTVDQTPPPAPRLLAPADGAFLAGAEVLLDWGAVTDNGPAGLSHYLVELDGAQAGGPIAPHITQLQVTVGAGGHSWRVLAVDRAGNASASPLRTFTVDAVPPAISVATIPEAPNAAGWFNQSVQVLFFCSANGGAPIASCTGSTTLSADTPPAGQTVTGTATNQAGFTATTSVTVRIDGSPPGAPGPTSPAANAVVASATPTLSWSAPDAGTSGLSRYRVLVDGAVVGEPTGTSLLVPTPLGQGPHSWQVLAIDNAGNVGPFSALTVFVVKAPPPPDAPLAGAPADTAQPSEQVTLATPAVASRARPPTVNAGRLRPRAGAVVRVLRPTLRWTPGPRGTRLYNLQIFEMRGSSLRKVVSAFPRANRFRVPAKRLRFGGRYVWRAWPFLASGGAAKRPVGISYFDVRRPARAGR